MLSQRAQEQAPHSPFNKMWDVMRDLWTPSNPQGSVDLGVAENKLMQSELKHFLENNINLHGSVVSYQDGPTGSHRLRHALAKFLTRHLNTHQPLHASHIIVTNGVSSALEHSAWALADENDAFLLGRPYYGAITLSQRPRVRTVPVTFGAIDPLSIAAVSCYERALLEARQRGQVVKGLLLCSPHNPLGRCYPRPVLLALLSLCSKHNLHLISDEVYALSVWRAPSFTSVLALDLSGLIDPRLVHVLWGVSKDFGANGWRLGCLVSPHNSELRTALGSVAIYSYASSIVDHVVAGMLEDEAFTEEYLAENRRRLKGAYMFTTEFLGRCDISYVRGVHAALFVWVDLGEAYRRRRRRRDLKSTSRRTAIEALEGVDEVGAVDEGEVVEKIKESLRQQRVYLAWGGDFDSESSDMFRIVFAHPTSYLEEGLRRIDRALGPAVGLEAGAVRDEVLPRSHI